MAQRTAVILSAGLTAFLLVAIGGVAALAAQQGEGVESATEAAMPPELEAAWQAREAEYSEALEQANQQLAEAYETIAAMDQAAPPEQAETVVYPISPELAVGLALNLAPGSKLRKWPELVNFQGTVAYQVLLDHGAIYISATDAILLHDGTTGGSSDDTGGYFDDDDYDDDEHEDEEDEEDGEDER